MFVMDSSLEWSDNKETQKYFSDIRKNINLNCPIVVLAHKQDLENAKSPKEIEEFIGIDKEKNIPVFGTSIYQEKDFNAPFEWLFNKI